MESICTLDRNFSAYLGLFIYYIPTPILLPELLFHPRSRSGGSSGGTLSSPSKRNPTNTTSTGGGGGCGGGSTSTSTSTAISGTKRDKPTTGLLRSLMIGPVQDRGSTMDIYRPSLMSASSSTASSSLASANPSPWRKVCEGAGEGWREKICLV